MSFSQASENSAQKNKSGFVEYFEALFIALILALFIRSFIIQAFTIPSGSMLQTLQIGDYLLVNKFQYGVRWPYVFKETNPRASNWWARHTLVMGPEIISVGDPEHEDIVVFEFPKNPSQDYIKRVIGIPGDTVEIRNKIVYRNGKKLDEPYTQFIRYGYSPGDNMAPITVPENKYFVMGDNRDESFDSRFWGFVDRTAIKGKALVIYWSAEGLSSVRWNRIGSLVHNL